MLTRFLVVSLLALSALGGLACTKAEAAPYQPPPDVMAEIMGSTRNVSELGATYGLNGSPEFLGCIGVTPAGHNNSTTTGDAGVPVHTSFSLDGNKFLILWPSAALQYLPSASASISITLTNGLPLKAEEKWIVVLKPTEAYIQGITASGTANLCVWGQG